MARNSSGSYDESRLWPHTSGFFFALFVSGFFRVKSSFLSRQKRRNSDKTMVVLSKTLRDFCWGGLIWKCTLMSLQFFLLEGSLKMVGHLKFAYRPNRWPKGNLHGTRRGWVLSDMFCSTFILICQCNYCMYKNHGTPKSSILVGFPL